MSATCCSLRLLPLACVGLVLSASAVKIDGVAAKVGSETILRSEILEEMRRANADESRYGEIRNEMINRKLILKAAADSKMTMQEWVVDNRIREIINKSFDGDRNRLIETLSHQKVSYPEWRARMKEDMVVSAMRWNVIEKNVSASPAAMRAEYAAHPERYKSEPKVTVSVILLKPEDSAKRIEVTAALKKESFADLARRYSADSHAAVGGVWKDVKPEDVFKPEICKEIAAMPKGTISHWIELDGWSFLLRKDDDTKGCSKSFEEAYDEIERNVKDEAADRVYAEWIERLRAETYIKVF